MKILQVIFTLGHGGAERMVVDLSNELSKEHEVTLCCILADGSESDSFRRENLSKRVQFVGLSNSRGYNANSFVQIYRLIRKCRPDVVHFHLSTVIYGMLPAFVFRSIRFVHTLHSIASKTCDKGLKGIMRRIYDRKRILSVTISPESELSFRSFFGFPSAAMIPNGRTEVTPSDQFEAVRSQIEELKRHPDDRVFIHVARYSEAKNQQMLVEVFNRLHDQGAHALLFIVGGLYDTGPGAEVKAAAGEGIHFLGAKNNVGDYLLCSDAFCMTSLWEGLPISLLEALSCGVTPICTPAGGIKDIVGIDGTGIITEGFTANEYYGAVRKFLDGDCKLRSREELMALYRDNYSMQRCASRYLDLYNLN